MRRTTRATAQAEQRHYATVKDKDKSTSKTDSGIPRRRFTTGTYHQPAVSVASTTKSVADKDEHLARKKWESWSPNVNSSPFPQFGRPTRPECEIAYRTLNEMHGQAVEKELKDPDTPETIPFVLDAMIVAILSQATSWSNAKRAMKSMENIYGSAFAYDKILAGGVTKLQETIRCGGLHIRKTKIIMSVLEQVQQRHQRWNLNYLFEMSKEDAMKELMTYKYIGPKSAFVVMSWCLKRDVFTVDAHVYRIAGLWDWRPQKATRETTQAHLDAVVPNELKLKLHFLLIAHGRTCPSCRGGSKVKQECEARRTIKTILNQELQN